MIIIIISTFQDLVIDN